MRALRKAAGLATVVAVFGAAGPALADDLPAKSDRIDIDAAKHQLVVLTDGAGHYVVIHDKYNSEHFYYGDGKVFYQQRVYGGSANTKQKSMSRTYWSPRSRPNNWGQIQLKNGAWKVTCDQRDAALTVVTGADAQKILDTAIFAKSKWRHAAYALARDDRGTYYYVDHLRKDRGGKGFRLWVGQRGNMKPQKMVNIVSDSEGDIFATKRGDLRMLLDKNQAIWVKGKRRTTLTYVPPRRNIYLIYSELGVYTEPLGTPCDDL